MSEDATPKVITEHGTITADTVILAGNGYLHGIDEDTESRVMPLNNFILTTEPLGDRGEALIPGREAAADSRFVVYYWRLTKDDRLLFGGGETYGHALPKDIKAFVRPHMLKLYPDLADVKIDYAWGGTLAVTPLLGADGEVYAVAQGQVQIGGFAAGGAAATMRRPISEPQSWQNSVTCSSSMASYQARIHCTWRSSV